MRVIELIAIDPVQPGQRGSVGFAQAMDEFRREQQQEAVERNLFALFQRTERVERLFRPAVVHEQPVERQGCFALPDEAGLRGGLRDRPICQ